MRYQLTGNEAWALTIMTLVYQPMVKNKTGSFPLKSLLGQLPGNERGPVQHGIQAFVDLNLLVVKGGLIHITNRSEAAFQFLGMMSSGSHEEVERSLANSPAIAKLLKDINDEIRLRPLNTTPTIAPVSQSKIASSNKPAHMSSWAKIGLTIFLVWVLLGLFKLITTKF